MCSWKLASIYFHCYFLSIASVLGIGILALPITVGKSGFTPFLVTIILNFVVQAVVVLFFVDLMQHAQVYLLNTQEKHLETVPLNELHSEDHSMDNSNSDPKGIYKSRHDGGEVVNLHSMCVLFLPKWLWLPFDLSILCIFISLLVSFSLAGSEAFAQLLRIRDYIYVIPFFLWTLALCIIFLKDFIKMIIVGLTFFKCSILITTTFATVTIGAKANSSITNDFRYIGSPFLICIVSLGGLMLVLPIIYNKVAPVKEQVQGFFLSALGGLITCTVLMILWVYSVLQIVPQVDGCSGKYTGIDNSSETTTLRLVSIHTDDCYSLERSRQLGEISTVPLTAIIVEEFPEYRWVGKTMQAFILISITVSFLAFGLAMIHLIGGILDSIQEMFVEGSSDTGHSPSKCQKLISYQLFRPSVFLLAFLFICVAALACPQGFVILVEIVVTVLLNISTGFFLVIMIHRSKTEKYRDLAVTWKFPEGVYYIKYFLALYCGFGIVFAFYKYLF